MSEAITKRVPGLFRAALRAAWQVAWIIILVEQFPASRAQNVTKDTTKGVTQDVITKDITVPPEALAIPRTSSPEVMERPIALTDRAGHLHQKVTTDSAEAQAYYDQGIANLHSYVWVDAARSFHEALRRDPELAMAHVGLAKAYGWADAYADAYAHLKTATELAAKGKVTAKEAKWISLGKQQMDAVFAPESERTRRHEEYKAAIEDLIVLDPDDPHAWVMRGNAEEARASGRGQGGRVGSIAYYEAALQRDPKFWPADHYLIHSYEGIGYYQKAGEHGKAYAAAVLGVPHAQHMYSHVLPRLGKWEEARSQLQKADRLQRDYFASGIDPVEEWHHGHNLQLLGVVELRLGNEKEAERYLREAFYLKVLGHRDGRFTDTWLEYLLSHDRFEEALAAGREAEQRPLPLARLIGAAHSAEALMALGRVEEAKKAQERAIIALGEAKQAMNNPLYDRVVNPYEEQLLRPLDAQFALLGDNSKDAEAQLIKLADRLVAEKGFDGWLIGLYRLERLAGVARRSGKPQLVQALLERMHRIDPDYTSRVTANIAESPGRTRKQP